MIAGVRCIISGDQKAGEGGQESWRARERTQASAGKTRLHIRERSAAPAPTPATSRSMCWCSSILERMHRRQPATMTPWHLSKMRTCHAHCPAICLRVHPFGSYRKKYIFCIKQDSMTLAVFWIEKGFFCVEVLKEGFDPHHIVNVIYKWC